MSRVSIKWKIFLFLIGFCGVLLILLWIFQVAFLDNFYKGIRTNDVISAAKLIRQNIESDNLEEIVNKLAQEDEIFVLIKDENEQRVLVSEDPRKQNPKPVRVGRIPENISLEENVALSSGKYWNVHLTAMVTPVNATVTTLLRGLYFITVFMIIFSVIFAFIIAKRVSTPIEKINKSAKELAKGNYDIHFTTSGYLEITELSETLNYTAKELSKVDGLRRELIANISHDLRTPLTLISGYAEAMRDLPEENNAENAQIIVDETVRLSTLVSDVLDISKLQSGVMSLNIQSFNLTLSLKSTINTLSELIKKEGYIFNFNYESELNVRGDEVKLLQAFYNLLTNALNYTGKDKTVTVNQIIGNDRVKIEVIDSGDGIALEDLPYIWDRYYKVDKTHKRAVAGTGLGLSIVKSIVELHSGEYGVDSQSGQTIFWFKLKLS